MKQLNFIIFLVMQEQEVSTYEIKPKPDSKPSKDNKALLALGENAINELQLQVDMKHAEDVQELSLVLVELLNYPNNDLADTHANAMRLGNFDLEKPKPSGSRADTSASIMDEKESSVNCPCCGFVKQVGTIDVGTSFDEIKNMGVSTYLYFSTYKKLAILLAILTVVYSGYAIATNYIASTNGTLANSAAKLDYLSISLSPKETNDNSTNRLYYFVQCWLGVATIAIWIFALAGMKYSEVKGIEEYDNDTISCSDYSVVMEGIPLDVTRDELQKQLDQFYQGLNPDSIPAKWRRPFKIAKLNVGKPFYLNQETFKDEELENITKELTEVREKIFQIVIERTGRNSFSLPQKERNALYERFRELNKKKADIIQSFTKKIKQSLKEQSNDETTTVFVTLENNLARSYLEQLHEPSILGRIRSICGKSADTFWYEREGKNYRLQIRRAPEPEDIIWTNLGQGDCATYGKKLLTFSITIVLLGISMAIVFGLSRAQDQSGGSRPISIAISLTISIVNVMLGQLIRRLTVFERDYTETHRQASLLIKSVLAQMINTILIPLITAYYIKGYQNLYFENGLVDNIFMLSISTIIVPPLLLILNPYRIAMALYRCYMSSPKNKLAQTQREYNVLQEGVEFEVGYQSIYPVSTFMFVCFFVSLQPIISVVALVGYLLMYWVEKYSLFNRYRRPVPGMDFVNNAVYKMISLGPMIYSFGSLTWANFSPNGIPPEAIIPNLIALALSIILFAIPFNSIILGACTGDAALKSTTFHDERIFMPSEYDRLNPSTQAEGFEDYKKYMELKKEEVKKLGKEQQEEFNKKMMINAQRGQMMNQARAQNFQAANPFQAGLNFFQPQPMSYGYSPYASYAAAPFMGYAAPYNPMASFGFGYAQPAPAMSMMGPAMVQARPAIINAPPPAQRPPQPQPQVVQGFNNPYPQGSQMGYPPNQGFNASPQLSANPFNQSTSVSQIYPQVTNPVVNNNPAFNPFNAFSNNPSNPYNSGFQPQQQGRRW